MLAVWLRSKDPDTRKKCLSALLPSAVGVIEPALYGISLERRRVFIITCIVSCITGIGMTVSGARAYRFAGFGVFGYAAYANPQMNDSRGMLLAIFWSIFAIVLSFVLVYFLHREETPEAAPLPAKQPQQTVSTQAQEIFAPVDGTLMPLNEVSDPVLASETLGRGCAIEPTGDVITAPFDGTIDLVAETKHAVGLTSPAGAQLLIHVGIDTVQLKGKGFTPEVTVGQNVKRGDVLLRFDPKYNAEAGCKLTTSVIVLNTDDYSDVRLAQAEHTAVAQEQKILELVP